MISSKDMELFRRVKPRKGFHVRRWGPTFARRVDRLFDAGLITWSTQSAYPGRSRIRLMEDYGIAACVHRHMGMLLELTPKGHVVWRKL